MKPNEPKRSLVSRIPRLIKFEFLPLLGFALVGNNSNHSDLVRLGCVCAEYNPCKAIETILQYTRRLLFVATDGCAKFEPVFIFM